MITTALDSNGKPIRITETEKGRDYFCPEPAGCVLRPVHASKRRSHFRHLRISNDCPDWANESQVHKQTKQEWFEFLKRQLSGCFVCTVALEATSESKRHQCPVKLSGTETHDPWYNSILWVCDRCSKPHVYDILDAGDSVSMEKWIFDRSCRPDITITDRAGNPKAVIEFRKSHSGKSREIADVRNVPWFEIEVLDGINSNVGLINESRQYWEDWLELGEKAKEAMRGIDLVLPGSTTFMPVFDDDGRLLDAYFTHKPNEDEENLTDYLPQPHRGHYLLAHRTNLGCESQQTPNPVAFETP